MKQNRQYKDHLFLGAIIALILAGAAAFAYLYFSNVFKPVPKMETFADNTYSETLHVVTDRDYEPFSYIDENGEYAGLDVELMNEIANRLNMNLDLRLMDWNDANAAISSGEADVIMNMETDLITLERGLIATLPTTEKQYVVYGRNNVNSVVDLYGKRVASLHQLPQLELDITYISSYAEMFERLKSGEFDYVICPIQVGNAFLQKLKLNGVAPSYAVGHVYGALALPADRTELRQRLNDVLKSLSDEGVLDALDRKWVNYRYEYSSVSSIVEGHPAFAAMLIAGLLLIVVLALLYIFMQRRGAAEKAAYTKKLQDNLEVIRSARVKAYMDELTGIRNKNAYRELEEEMQLSLDRGNSEPFAVVVFDVNGLKEVNDKLGHQAGDQYIVEACRLICRIYEHSPVYRIGGDEFVAVLRGSDYENRRALLALLQDIVLANQAEGRVIVAAGMSEYDRDPMVSAVFERADKTMYQNKVTLKGARN